MKLLFKGGRVLATLVFLLVLITAVITTLSFIYKYRVLAGPEMSSNPAEKVRSSQDSPIERREEEKEEKKKLLLLYSTWFGQRTWGDFDKEELTAVFQRCQMPNCYASYNKSLIQQADVLLFHGRDVEVSKSGPALRKLRETAPHRQKWVFLSHETPQYDPELYQPYDGIFNWTATYSRASSVHTPYATSERFARRKNVQHINYAATKKRFVAWAVSNCIPWRQDYGLELEKYLPFTVYGGCSKFFKSRGRNCQKFKTACDEEISTYKFYLAFENAFCYDWVSEKYWTSINRGVVPVVMGANFGQAIPGSYINVNDFCSIKDLADYLKYLDKNDDKYNEYFRWKEWYGLTYHPFYCGICAAINSEKYSKVTQLQLSEEYNAETDCTSYDWKREKMMRQVEKSKLWRKLHQNLTMTK